MKINNSNLQFKLRILSGSKKLVGFGLPSLIFTLAFLLFLANARGALTLRGNHLPNLKKISKLIWKYEATRHATKPTWSGLSFSNRIAALAPLKNRVCNVNLYFLLIFYITIWLYKSIKLSVFVDLSTLFKLKHNFFSCSNRT